MQKDTEKAAQAFRELVRVLEDAVQAGADSIELEYEDRNWIVYHNFGDTGLGAARIAQELQQDVISQIYERAGLSRKARGKMQVTLLDKDYEVAVKTHDSFGESVYHLTLKERKEKEEATVQKKKKKKDPASKASAPIRWEFDPNIPTHDFFEGRNLEELWGLQEAVENFVFMIEGDTFLSWEAVVCEEQGLPLTAKQKKALSGLLDFNDEEDDEILYIDESARPSEPWYVILSKLVPYLVIEPFRTFEHHEEVKCDGWRQIVTALRGRGEGLSLPLGVESPEEVVPAEMRHKLWLQFCFNDLSGLGQDKEMTLEDPEEHYRVDWFIKNMREHKETVAYFDLTLESLLTRVIMPEKDRSIFLRMMQEKLGLNSTKDPIVSSH